MRPSLLMAQLVADLRHAYPVVETVSGFCQTIVLPGRSHLVVLELDRGVLVSVGAYLEDERGLRVADPEIVFYLDWQEQWLPAELTQAVRGKTVYATVADGCLAVLDPVGQTHLAHYADVWAQHLRALLHLADQQPYAPPVVFTAQELSPQMQQFIEQLAAQEQVNLTQPGAFLRVDTATHCLLVERSDHDHLSVRYCQKEAELLVPDPDFVFFTGFAAGWAPVEICHSPETWDTYVQWAQTAGQVAIYDAQGELIFAHFTEYWAQQLRTQAWSFTAATSGDDSQSNRKGDTPCESLN
ncbi:MAG: hypothetical protein U0350_48775 [Caldilineaceae bacterium]